MPITILFLAANPTDTARLHLGDEARAIDQALREAALRDTFTLEQAHAVRVADLQGLLLRHRPHVVHFSGHGAASGEILLQDDQGRAAPVAPQALATTFELLKDNIRCVVLNACFSQAQAEAIARHVDCVVGMPAEIEDAAARAFAAAFYSALAYGRSVQSAFDLGRNRMDLGNLHSQDEPVLLSPHSDPRAVVLSAGATLATAAPASFRELKRQGLQRRHALLVAEWQAVDDQLTIELNPASQVKLGEQRERLAAQIADLERQIAQV